MHYNTPLTMLIVFAVTTDTDPTMYLFGKLLEVEDIIHVYCTDHVLHTTCKQCYSHDNYCDSSGTNAIQQATYCVSFFNQSTQAVECLKYHQQTNALYAERKFAPGVKPLIDSVTRWWSTHRMVERLLYRKHALESMAAENTLATAKQINDNQ